MRNPISRNVKLSPQEQERVGKEAEASRARLDEKLKARTDYQERSRMSPEARARGAIDEMALDMKRMNEAQGKEIRFEEARKYIEEKIAGVAERKHDK